MAVVRLVIEVAGSLDEALDALKIKAFREGIIRHEREPRIRTSPMRGRKKRRSAGEGDTP